MKHFKGILFFLVFIGVHPFAYAEFPSVSTDLFLENNSLKNDSYYVQLGSTHTQPAQKGGDVSALSQLLEFPIVTKLTSNTTDRNYSFAVVNTETDALLCTFQAKMSISNNSSGIKEKVVFSDLVNYSTSASSFDYCQASWNPGDDMTEGAITVTIENSGLSKTST